jgi:hypothetical protein
MASLATTFKDVVGSFKKQAGSIIAGIPDGIRDFYLFRCNIASLEEELRLARPGESTGILGDKSYVGTVNSHKTRPIGRLSHEQTQENRLLSQSASA